MNIDKKIEEITIDNELLERVTEFYGMGFADDYEWYRDYETDKIMANEDRR